MGIKPNSLESNRPVAKDGEVVHWVGLGVKAGPLVQGQEIRVAPAQSRVQPIERAGLAVASRLINKNKREGSKAVG